MLKLRAALVLLTACGGGATATPAVNHPSTASNAPAARAGQPAPIRPDECGVPIDGVEGVAQAPVVLLGEVHGQVGPPTFAINVSCRLALARPTALALEIPAEEQPRIDAYLASDGGGAARAALLEGDFWRRPFQDGRSSAAMLDMIEKARQLVRRGLKLRLVACDRQASSPQQDREKQMADALLAVQRSSAGPVVMLVGNLHARTRAGAPWDPSLRFMGTFVKEAVPGTMALDVRYGPGESWVCLSSVASECGRKPTKGADVGPRWSIDLDNPPAEIGMAGTFSVGPAIASPPARAGG